MYVGGFVIANVTVLHRGKTAYKLYGINTLNRAEKAPIEITVGISL